jgi:hypothetical protein
MLETQNGAQGFPNSLLLRYVLAIRLDLSPFWSHPLTVKRLWTGGEIRLDLLFALDKAA